jgi:hypothetical protein
LQEQKSSGRDDLGTEVRKYNQIPKNCSAGAVLEKNNVQKFCFLHPSSATAECSFHVNGRNISCEMKHNMLGQTIIY